MPFQKEKKGIQQKSIQLILKKCSFDSCEESYFLYIISTIHF